MCVGMCGDRCGSGSCTLPFYGIELVLLDPSNGQEVHGDDVEGVLCVKRPWPSVTRTVYGDHERYLTVSGMLLLPSLVGWEERALVTDPAWAAASVHGRST